nr:MAG TPA: hypothetical protein [Caudoviricetes sp.]
MTFQLHSKSIIWCKRVKDKMKHRNNQHTIV